MATLQIDTATQADAMYVAENIRDEDRAEMEATSIKGNIRDNILLNMRLSKFTYAARVGDEVLCIGGIIIDTHNQAQAWLLTSKDVDKHWRLFSRASRSVIMKLVTGFSVVYNYVDIRYIKSIRWLAWIGFVDGPVYNMAPSGLPFVKMSLKVRS